MHAGTERCITALGYLPDNIVAAEPVLVHDGDDDGGLPQHMSRDIEGEGLVENGIQTALHHNCLLLFYTLVLVHEPHLHVGICKADAKRGCLHESNHKDARG